MYDEMFLLKIYLKLVSISFHLYPINPILELIIPKLNYSF